MTGRPPRPLASPRRGGSPPGELAAATAAGAAMADRPGEPPWPSPLRSGLLLALLLGLYTLSFIDRTILVLLIEPLKRDLDLTDVEVSLLVGAAFTVFYATAGIPLGYVADRWNRRNLIAIGVALWSLMTAAGGFAGGFVTLFISRMGVGLGEAALSPSAYSMLADSYPRHRLSRAMAIYTVGSSLGSGLALVIGGLMLSFAMSPAVQAIPGVSGMAPWRLTLILAGVPGLLMVGLVLLLREPARRAAAAPSAGQAGEGLLRFLRQRWRLVAPLFLGVSLHTAIMYGANTWLPTYFSRNFDVAPSAAAVPLGIVQALSGTLGMLLGAIWTDRRVRAGASDAHLRVLLVGTAVAGLFFALAPLAPTPLLAYASLTVAFTFGMFQGGIVPAAIQLVTPAHLRARMIAIYLMAMSLIGLGLGPTIVAVAATYIFGEARLGLALVFTVLVLSPLATLLILAATRPFRRAYGVVASATAA